MRAPPARLVIVGGGTAGWMAANLLQQAWGKSTQLTLIESPRIPTVGVGEGSTPLLRQFFARLQVPEREWMPACDATYKAGIVFDGWTGSAEFPAYFHPFFSALDLPTGEQFFANCNARRRGVVADTDPGHFFVAARLAERQLSPVPLQALNCDVDYGYHFDAAKLADFLRERAVSRGLTLLRDEVTEVRQAPDGRIAALATAQSGIVDGDFFVDCTGFAGLLLERTLKVGYQSFADNLFNDAAVAIATPHKEGEPLAPQTRSTALSCGWAWRIPLQSRCGNGYVYSSSHLSAEQAERELRRHCGAAETAGARHLKMRVGRLEKHWHRNCLAVGLSQGFIEPLEATALMLVQFTLERFIQQYPAGAEAPFNDELNRMFEGIRDYIVAHYVLNTRDDSDYWRDCRERALPGDNLRALLQVWDGRGDFDAELHRQRAAQVYLRPSWYCILAGMGRFPAGDGRRASAHAALMRCDDIARQLFGDHRAQLAALAQ